MKKTENEENKKTERKTTTKKSNNDKKTPSTLKGEPAETIKELTTDRNVKKCVVTADAVKDHRIKLIKSAG